MAYSSTLASLIADSAGALTTWASEFSGYTEEQQKISMAVVMARGRESLDQATGTREVHVDVFDVVGDTVHAGNVTAWTAPAAAIITRVILNITTASTGASTIDIGYTATSATTTSDTFLDGVSGATIAQFDSMNYALDSGANAKAQNAASGKWITIDEASGDTSGLVGKLYIEYILV